MEDVFELKVPRAQWLRGQGGTVLWDPRVGSGCILGHLGRAMGFTLDDLGGLGRPEEVIVDDNKWPEWVCTPVKGRDETTTVGWVANPTAEEVMKINDDENTPDSSKEQSLAMIFMEHKIILRFV